MSESYSIERPLSLIAPFWGSPTPPFAAYARFAAIVPPHLAKSSIARFKLTPFFA
jgi:hypothetical protein